jgi:hypothetical protein
MNHGSTKAFKEVLLQGKALCNKAMTCVWTTPDQREAERQAATVQEWAKDMGWKTASGKIKNEQHDGYLEGRSTCLVAAEERERSKDFHNSSMNQMKGITALNRS